MDKKLILKIIKIVLLILVILILIYCSLRYLDTKRYIEKSFFRDWPIIGYTGYGEDPCYHEPHEPDPCGGS